MTNYALISKYNYQISPASTFREKLSTSMWEITSLATFRDISFTRLGVGRDVTMLCRSSDPGQRNTIREDAAAPLVSKVSHWGN